VLSEFLEEILNFVIGKVPRIGVVLVEKIVKRIEPDGHVRRAVFEFEISPITPHAEPASARVLS
jgi:hypothetical protein